MYPEVSIIIPAYNHEKYVESAVLSALSQTYKQIEILLLNDGSTDSTGDVCEKLATRHRSIRYFSHANIGAHNTINKGIQAASGQYISILNSDDIFFPNKIKRCIELVDKDKSLQIISGNVKFIDADGTTHVKGISMDWQKKGHEFFELSQMLPLSILNENFIATTSNMFFTKTLWHNVGGFQPLRYCHDLDFLMSGYRSGGYYYDRDVFHIMYRVHDANTIKEELSKIRVEIAAVIASSLIIDNMTLLQRLDTNKINHLINFLKNKNISNLIILLMMYYLNIGKREIFYQHIYQDKIKNIFSSALE